MRPAVLIIAGGTGGHVFPALAVASELRARAVDVCWMGTEGGIEARIVPGADIEIDWVNVSGVRRKGVLAYLLAPFVVAMALTQSLRILTRRRPSVVLGMGGFVSGPGGIAAWLTRRPLVLHEQNSVAGLTNRILARFARRVLTGFPDSFPARVEATVVGNPVRKEITAVRTPRERFSARQGAARLLVLGGSQGALILNRIVALAIAHLEADERPVIRHQAGELTLHVAEQAYDDAEVDAEVTQFIDDMAGALTWADLVICRAGALTIAELAAVGVASILVPYPYAVDDHQTRNARFLADAGAAVLIPERELSSHLLADRLKKIFADDAGRLRMAEQSRTLARPDAAADVASACLELAEARS